MAQSYSRPKPCRNEPHASMPNIVDRLYIGPIHRRSHDFCLEGARRPRNFVYTLVPGSGVFQLHDLAGFG